MNTLIDVYERMDVSAILSALFICTTLYLMFKRDRYADIPTVGSANFLLSYIDVVRYTFRGLQMLQEGYEKFSQTTGIFRIPSFTGWQVFVCGNKELEQMKSIRGETELSGIVAAKIFLSGDYTIGNRIWENPYHTRVVRANLTKNIDTWFDSIRAEIVDAFEELIPPTTDWKSFKLYPTVTQLMTRAGNCVIISDPTIFRERSYLTTMSGFTLDTTIAALTLSFFPDVLKPLAQRWVTNLPRSLSSTMEALRKTIEEREAKLAEYGSNYSDKPIDLLSFFMDVAEGEERTTENLARRVLMMNFATIHTTTMTLSLILRDLADRPEYIKPLREEIESIISQDGLTKASLAKMRKLDSFMMESQRVKPPRAIAANRWSMKDYTFSNGIRIPKDTMVAATMIPRNYDSTLFENPHKFDGFRFCQGGDNDNAGRNLSLVSSASPLLLFGMGDHMCPGRFFVAVVLKMAIIHFLQNYDIQLDPNNLPCDSWIGPDLYPSASVTLMVREKKKEVDG